MLVIIIDRLIGVKMFLVDLVYKADISIVEKFTPEHRAWLDEQYKAGHFMFSGPKKPRTGGIIIAKMNSREDLQTLLANDPFAKNQVAEYHITEFIAMKTHGELQQFVEK